MYTANSRVHISWLAVALIASSGCTTTGDGGDTFDEDTLSPEARGRLGDARFARWRETRAQRQAELDQFLAAHPREFESFRYAALAASGVPTLLLRNFSTVFPDIWGTPDEHFGPQGFTADPFRADSPLPLGLGTSVVNGVELATLTC